MGVIVIDRIALVIDSCSDNGDIPGLIEAIKNCHIYLECLHGDDSNIPLIYYFIANAYSAIKDIKNNGKSSDWDWEDDTRCKELLYLRKCISSNSFNRLDKIRQCQAFTNLANLLDNTGRPIQATKNWNMAITVDKYFQWQCSTRPMDYIHLPSSFLTMVISSLFFKKYTRCTSL